MTEELKILSVTEKPLDLKTLLASYKPRIMRRITEIDRIVREAVELLIRAAQPFPLDTSLGKRWAYSWKSSSDELADKDKSADSQPEKEATKTYSVSTQAMCAVAVGEIIRDASLRLDDGQAARLTATRDDVTTLLFSKISTWIATTAYAWESSTFGDDDIFTATWLKQLAEFCNPNAPDIIDRLDRIIDNAIQGDNFTDRRLFNPASGNDAGPHALPLLRVIETALATNPESPKVKKAVHTAGHWFDRNLHRQASYFQFRDFRFDAAELVFCLRGVIVTQHLARTDTLIKHVLAIVREAQERSVYWRPYRPMVSNNKGGVLLPLSIEVATVLLGVLEETKNFDEFGDTLERYYEWLENQRVVPKELGVSLSGWHSENTYDSNAIHVWDTARVALFLKRYREALSKSLHREVIRTSGFSTTSPKQIKIDLNDLIPFDLGVTENAFHLIEPRIANDRDFSFLFYGPPGVSKSTLARAIAKKAGRQLIELTPSDFISGGEAEIETRAKEIFAGLMCLRRAIVFFDEIDQLILDRDSGAYGKQGDIFKFMTPSMLSKLQDLRSNRAMSFIIATNYADHIDRAIKRQGRIDQSILILPPNKAARQVQWRTLIDRGTPQSAWSAEDESLLEELAMRTALFVYQEMAGAVEPYAAKVGFEQSRRRSILEAILGGELRPPQISLGAYSGRLKDEGFPQKPYDEFLRLLLLRVECGHDKDLFKEVHSEARGALSSPEFAFIMRGVKAAAVDPETRAFVEGLA